MVTIQPKCEDCWWYTFQWYTNKPACANPEVGQWSLERARASGARCGPEGKLHNKPCNSGPEGG